MTSNSTHECTFASVRQSAIALRRVPNGEQVRSRSARGQPLTQGARASSKKEDRTKTASMLRVICLLLTFFQPSSPDCRRKESPSTKREESGRTVGRGLVIPRGLMSTGRRATYREGGVNVRLPSKSRPRTLSISIVNCQRRSVLLL